LADVLASAFEGIDRAAGADGDTRCDRCGAVTEWHRTLRGRWIMIEPGARPTGSIPAGKRWRIAGDGTAVNLGAASPTDTCRISHFDICPAKPAPVDSPTLLALWWRNTRTVSGGGSGFHDHHDW
jgi:hypothetical protein